MIDSNITQVLAQMRSIASAANWPGALPPTGSAPSGAPTQPSFAATLKASLGAVNDVQQQATQMTERFQRGEPGLDLGQVMVSMEKSSVSFEAMKQVRNKLVDAYQEVMRMQI